MSARACFPGPRILRFLPLALIFASTCCASALADTWSDGQFIAYQQGTWGDDATPSAAATILVANYNAVYASNEDVFEVGSASGSTTFFTSATTLLEYLPSAGSPAALDSNLVDPTFSSSGVFGGDVAALQLNVDFSDGGLILDATGISFGNLVLANMTAT